MFWAIRIKDINNMKHIGNIKIDPIDLKIKSGQYGMIVGDKSEWGKGLCLRSIKNYSILLF